MNADLQKEIVAAMGYQPDKKDVSLALSKLNQKDQYYAVNKSEVNRIPVRTIIRAGKSLEIRSLSEIIDSFSFEAVLHWVKTTSDFKRNEIIKVLGLKCTCLNGGQGDRNHDSLGSPKLQATPTQGGSWVKGQCMCISNDKGDATFTVETGSKHCLCAPVTGKKTT